LLNRNFHVPTLQHLSVEIDGEEIHTGAAYGFLMSFKKMQIEKDKDEEIYVVWDGGGENWRHKLTSDYKANRKQKTDIFHRQQLITQDILRSLGVAQCQAKGEEADDLIGSLAKFKRLQGNTVIIISSDKDFNQLVSRHIQVLHPKMSNNDEKLMTPAQIEEDFGIPPSKFADWLALRGDSSDNIKGLEGVGKKTATELILGSGSVEEILSTDRHFLIKKGEKKPASRKLQEKINNSKEILKLSRQLVDIKCDISLKGKITRQKPDFHLLKTLFKKYQFKKCLQDFNEFVRDFS